jgi:hypothetical protein
MIYSLIYSSLKAPLFYFFERRRRKDGKNTASYFYLL